METYEWIYIGVFFSVVIIISSIILTKFVIKPSLKKMRISTYFGLKSAKVKFKAFDSFASHSLFVSPRREYEVVYRLETEEGEIRVRLDGQLDISTTSRKEGSEIIKFSRFQPIVEFEGYKAKNGVCSIKVYKRR